MCPDATYHLFNHGNGCENLFRQEKNYHYFLERIYHHILPICHIFSYCLLPNHFHLLLQIRKIRELNAHFNDLRQKRIRKLSGTNIQLPVEEWTELQLEQKLSQPFSNFFNGYTQAFNKLYSRRGSLFMPNMKTKEVRGDEHFRHVVRYIHANPVHHKFEKVLGVWPFNSYNTFLGNEPTKLNRDYVLKQFGGLDNFIEYHKGSDSFLTLGGLALR